MHRKKRLLSFLREVILIFIGLLLALIVNDWWDEQRKLKETNKALSTVSNEVENNLDILKTRVRYHQALHDSLLKLNARVLSGSVKIFPQLNELGFNQGLGIDKRLKKIAWEFVITSQLYSKVNYGLRLYLSEAYAAQSQLLLVESMVLDCLMSYMTNITDNQPKISDLNLLMLLSGDLVRVENDLSDNLEKAKTLLKGK